MFGKVKLVILSTNKELLKFHSHMSISKNGRHHTHTHTSKHTQMQLGRRSAPSLPSSLTSLHLILSGVSKASFAFFLMDAFQTEFPHMLGGAESCWRWCNNVEPCRAHLWFQPSLRPCCAAEISLLFWWEATMRSPFFRKKKHRC